MIPKPLAAAMCSAGKATHGAAAEGFLTCLTAEPLGSARAFAVTGPSRAYLRRRMKRYIEKAT